MHKMVEAFPDGRSFAFAEESEISFTDHLCGPHVTSDDINVNFSVGGDNHGSRNALSLQHGIQSASFEARKQKRGKELPQGFSWLSFRFPLESACPKLDMTQESSFFAWYILPAGSP
jgi:hypothetical protein